MNQPVSKYEELTEVLAMINEMIEESAYHTETFAHVLETHHNNKAAEVFLRASEQFNAELVITMRHAKDIQIPDIPPWETLYPGYIHPSSLLSHAHYLMSEEEAWEAVDAMIKIHQSFYSFLCKESTEDKVLVLANTLVDYCGKYWERR